jgi:chromosome segregation ATPase
MRLYAFSLFAVVAHGHQTNPISKVLDLLHNLKEKVASEGEAEQAAFEKESHMCKDQATSKQYEIRDDEESVASLSATIEKAAATITELDSKIARLTTAVSKNENDLAAAHSLRKAEHDDYVANDKESVEVVSTLERGIATLEKALKKGSSLVQAVSSPQMKKLTDSLSAIVDAGVFSTNDKKRLAALMQSKEDSEFAMGQAPEAASYETHDGSSSILDLLGDLLDKAESQKASADKAEMTAQFEFNKLKQSLTNQIAFDNKQLDAARKGLAEQQEVKATAQGDLTVTQKELSEDTATLNDLHDACEEAATEFETGLNQRKGEIEALDSAVKILKDKTGGAESQAYGLVQTAQRSVQHDYTAVLKTIVGTGKESKDKQLAMLAVRVKAALGSSADPFAKVKGLIADMLERLEKQAADDAAQHEFCTTETAKSTEKKEDKQSEIESLAAKIAKAKSTIAKRKEQVSNLQSELADIAKSDKEMTELRSSEHATFEQAEKDYSDGVEGVQMALKVIRDYYAQGEGKSGAGGSIISMLEVAESDFSRMLTEVRETEATAESEYEKLIDEHKLESTTKKGGVKYKNQEIGQLEKAVAENTDSRVGVEEELDAVLEYLSKLNDQCIAKPEPYEERKRRREAELEGLKNALEILEGDAIGFLAVKTVRRHA